MSQRCMPLLFLNMGGEMAYILEQRLKNVGEEKSAKVLNDILYTMLNRKFLEELFKPQEIHSRRTMRQFFEKLAHSSIMRLNETSMDKLYDLMTMTVKWQLQIIDSAEQILAITINHIDGIRALIPDDQKLAGLLDNVYNMVTVNFGDTPLWEWCLIRSCLLNFFQDARVKVSLLLREKRQLDNGNFVFFPGDEVKVGPAGTVPGKIQYYENGESTKSVAFPTKRTYIQNDKAENLAQMATDRICKLGINIYKSTDSVQVKGGGGTGKEEVDRPSEELKLLTDLLAGYEGQENAGGEGFNLSLFSDEKEEATFQKETEKALANVKRFDASKDKKTLNKAIEEMKIEDGGKKKKARGEDMLEMLDEAAARPATAKKRTASTKRAPSKDKEGHESRPTSSKGARSRENSAKGPRDRTGSAVRRKPSNGPK